MAAESHPNRQYSDTDLLDPIRDFADEHGRPPSSPEYNEVADPNRTTLRDRFGSYADAVAAAGCDPADTPSGAVPGERYDDAELLAPIHAFVDEHGRPPRQKEYQAADGPSCWTIYDHYNGFLDAVRAAGYDPADIPDDSGGPVEYTDDELLEWIESFVSFFGVVPSHNDLEGWPGPVPQTYSRRFGSVSAAVREAGFEPRGDA